MCSLNRSLLKKHIATARTNQIHILHVKVRIITEINIMKAKGSFRIA